MGTKARFAALSAFGAFFAACGLATEGTGDGLGAQASGGAAGATGASGNGAAGKGAAGSPSGKAGGSGFPGGPGGSAGTGGAGGKSGASGKGGTSGGSGSSGKGGIGGGSGSSGKGGIGGGSGGSGKGGTGGSSGKGGTGGGGTGGAPMGGTGGAAATGGAGTAGTGGIGAMGGTGGGAATGGIGGAGASGGTGGTGGGGCTLGQPCTTADAKNGVCPVGPDCAPCTTDPDCAIYPGGSHVCEMGSCVPGDCHDDSTCVAGDFCGLVTPLFCGACDPGPGATWYVDPVNGDDATTGSGAVGGVTKGKCALKTVAQALVLAGTTPGATILLVGSVGGTTAADTKFPLVLKANVTIKAKDSSNPVTFTIPAGAIAFELYTGAPAGADGASLSGVVLDGSAKSSDSLVDISLGLGGNATLFDATLKNGGTNGIIVTTGTVAMGPGVVVTGSKKSGMALLGGTVTLSATAAQSAISFSTNADGITMAGGVLNVNGVPDALKSGLGSVVVSQNIGTGVDFQSSMAASPSAITGLVAYSNGTHGVRIAGGSLVKVRGSQFLGNTATGVCVGDTCDVNSSASTDASGIDLGTAGDLGLNVFDLNAKVGLCLAFTPAAAGVLTAEGNFFGAFDCTVGAPTLGKDKMCHAKQDVGFPMPPTIDIKTCK